MKKVLPIVIAVVILIGGAYLYTSYAQTGAIKSTFDKSASADKTIKELLPQGKDLASPLNIPEGMRIGVFADLGEGKPRVLAQDPNGILVASIPNDGRIVGMPDAEEDGIADKTVEILTGLNRPHGVLFNEGFMYVAETDKVTRFVYDARNMRASNKEVLFELPSGSGHATRTIKVIDNKLYTTIGSSCNVCVESDPRRAAMYVSNLDGSDFKLFAKGLRNTVFFTADALGKIWGNDMGRDLLGDNLPPDELNILTEGDFGWPYCYGQNVRDIGFLEGKAGGYCATTKASTYRHPAHVAPLGITFINSKLFSEADQGNILVAYHGSWNSSVPVGYKVVKLTVKDNKVTSSEDFLSGFIKGEEVLGRPVDLLFDQTGYLYITDDHAGLVYVVSKAN